MSQVSDCSERIEMEWRAAQDAWSSVRSRWRDDAARQLEEGYYARWADAIAGCLAAMRELDAVVDRAARACDSLAP